MVLTPSTRPWKMKARSCQRTLLCARCSTPITNVYIHSPLFAPEEEFQIKTPYFKEKIDLKVKNGDNSNLRKQKECTSCRIRGDVPSQRSSVRVTTNDILFNLTQDKVMEKAGAPIERNAAHLLQHSFCPQSSPRKPAQLTCVT